MDPIDLERIHDRADGGDSSENLLRAEAGQAVREALAELPADHRELLAMLHEDAKPSYRDISRRLGIPTGVSARPGPGAWRSYDEPRPCAAT